MLWNAISLRLSLVIRVCLLTIRPLQKAISLRLSLVEPVVVVVRGGPPEASNYEPVREPVSPWWSVVVLYSLYEVLYGFYKVL